jgi:hypothetical protein
MATKQTSGKETKTTKQKFNVKDFANRISKGENMTNPEQLQFYENNKAAIESELQAIQLASGTTPPATQSTPPASTETVFNPLEQPVNEKPYSGTGANGQQQVSDIPEPTYQTAPEEKFVPEKEISKTEQKQIDKAKQNKNGNPDLANASEAEKMEGAAALATVVLTTWEQAYAGLNQVFKISEKKINKLQQSGQIDVRVEVPYKMSVAPLSSVFRDYNNDAQNLLVLEPEFKEAVHPLMTEEFAKSGHGMSNKGQLIFLVATKLASDGMKAAQFISLKKDYLKFAREATVSSRRVAPRVQQIAVAETEPPTPNNETTGNETGEEANVQQPMTIQQEALNRLGPPGGVNNTANFGSPETLSKLNKEHAKDQRAEKKSAPKKSAIAAVHIAHAKTSSDPIPDGKKKGRGRPKGSPNKKGKKK